MLNVSITETFASAISFVADKKGNRLEEGQRCRIDSPSNVRRHGREGIVQDIRAAGNEYAVTILLDGRSEVEAQTPAVVLSSTLVVIAQKPETVAVAALPETEPARDEITALEEKFAGYAYQADPPRRRPVFSPWKRKSQPFSIYGSSGARGVDLPSVEDTDAGNKFFRSGTTPYPIRTIR